MGGRGAGSTTARRAAAGGTKAQAVAAQIDPELTGAFLALMMAEDRGMYASLSPEEAVQNLIDLSIPADYYESEIAADKKEISAAKRTLNSNRAKEATKERAQIKMNVAQRDLLVHRFNFEAAKILESWGK